MQNITIEDVLQYAIEHRASDIHISEGENIVYRVEGEITVPYPEVVLTKETLNSLGMQLFREDASVFSAFLDKKDEDFAFIAEDGTPFRVNGFFKLGKMAFVMRRIEKEAAKISDLGLPEGIAKALRAKQGLFLITGPTGSGKSTTMVSMLDTINENRSEHIITIEDPVEFIFTNKKSIFSQREAGKDTDNFNSAIRASVREDPDIVMIGEMRDEETVDAALKLAETGHLVFSTLHTSGSVATINRLVQFFHPDIQHQVRSRISDSLLGVLSQRLLPRRDKEGRVAIFELMYNTAGIANLIRAGDLVQIDNVIIMGSQDGMVPMRTYAEKLQNEGILNYEDYAGFFTNNEELQWEKYSIYQ